MKKLPNNAAANSTAIPARFASDMVRSLLQSRTSRLQQVLLCVKISKKKCPTVDNVLKLFVTRFSLQR
jgi:hypothetical protein